jgi:hypothetical protein
MAAHLAVVVELLGNGIRSPFDAFVTLDIVRECLFNKCYEHSNMSPPLRINFRVVHQVAGSFQRRVLIQVPKLVHDRNVLEVLCPHVVFHGYIA